MANGILSGTFELKRGLDIDYPDRVDMTAFDLEREHFFYGRVDKEGDAIIIDNTDFLVGVESASTGPNWLMDFVADAFYSLKVNHRKATRAGFDRNSVFYRDLKVHKSQSYSSMRHEYDKYINIFYKNFVDEYLDSNRRAEKIKNFKDFVKEFMRYVAQICDFYPLTKTGYITSVHCSPFVSGLMLEIAPELHDISNATALEKYFDDKYFDYWVTETAKFGFMVDKNSPWRLVFNLASGHNPEYFDDLVGAQLFMSYYGISYENVMEYRYKKAYKEELENIKMQMFSLYRSFYRQFSTYEQEEFQFDKNGRCQRVKVTHRRKDREPPPGKLSLYGGKQYLTLKEENDEYWLKIVMKLRMIETKYHHTVNSYTSHADDMIKKFRVFGLDAALNYINNLTKGFAVTKFNIRGENWHGVREEIYTRRLDKALEKAQSPPSADYTLTGTKNSIGR